MKHRVVVIDGMGGGIGVQLIGRLRALEDGDREIIALGTNSTATERMLKAGAHRGATGENALKISVATGDFIMGPIGIVIANSLMGEISPGMAEAVLSAPGERILLPLQNEHFLLAGPEALPLAKQADRAVELYRERLRAKENGGPSQ
ncbi:MAG: DUF3842 family protein [Spirochaetaceae bacterium]|jgi:hypothetical protein|nr:DUF3842 family protein [Spirochaetaceae bacterium]